MCLQRENALLWAMRPKALLLRKRASHWTVHANNCSKYYTEKIVSWVVMKTAASRKQLGALDHSGEYRDTDKMQPSSSSASVLHPSLTQTETGSSRSGLSFVPLTFSAGFRLHDISETTVWSDRRERNAQQFVVLSCDVRPTGGH